MKSFKLIGYRKLRITSLQWDVTKSFYLGVEVT